MQWAGGVYFPACNGQGVCVSQRAMGVSASGSRDHAPRLGGHPQGRHLPGQTPLPSRSPLADTLSPNAATEVGGTHPTGMHSCFVEVHSIGKFTIKNPLTVHCKGSAE